MANRTKKRRKLENGAVVRIADGSWYGLYNIQLQIPGQRSYNSVEVAEGWERALEKFEKCCETFSKVRTYER